MSVNNLPENIKTYINDPWTWVTIACRLDTREGRQERTREERQERVM
jgi:hypothetical protein